MTQIKKSLGILLIAGIGGMTSLMIYKSTEKKSETAFQTAVPAYKVSMPEGGAAIADFTVAAEKTIPAVVHVKTSYAAQRQIIFFLIRLTFGEIPDMECHSNNNRLLVTV